ncbi:MAG TPA: winged helix-turn-helix domain-containing protein [Myxococcaceae bacterium]|jgi:GntR family transcriptional repressor for pyruvate dehydrogenase complex
MERLGLVAQVEAELEKMLALGLLPPDGKMPSEHGLARCFKVSRGTVREALRSLSAKGLVEQYPGRRTRVVAWDRR